MILDPERVTSMFKRKYIMRKISALLRLVVPTLLLFVFIQVSYPLVAVAQSPAPPDFRLPLPGGKDWKLSTEAGTPTKQCKSGWGGLSNDGEYDCLHTNKNLYSLDLVDNNRQDGELSGKADVNIFAAADGTVLTKVDGLDNCYNSSTESCPSGCGYGNYVVIKHGNYTSFYGHLKKNSIPTNVSDGQPITRGDKIGTMGNTGCSTGIHIHFEIRYNGEGLTESQVLNQVSIDGKNIRDYKLSSNPYYRSTNGSCGSGLSESSINNSTPIHPNGTLVKVSSAQTVYLLRGGQKLPLAPGMLTRLYNQTDSGFDFDEVVTISADELARYPLGDIVGLPLPGNGRSEPEGRLIQPSDGRKEISIVSDGQRRAFSGEVFRKLGYLFECRVRKINDYDSYPTGPDVTGTIPANPMSIISLSSGGKSGTNGQTLTLPIPFGRDIKVSFNGLASQARGAAIRAYNWTRRTIFGNNVQQRATADTTFTSSLPSFEDNLGPGTHNITLQVVDEAGLSDTKSATIVITETSASAPQAVLSMSSGGQTGGNGSTLNYTVAPGGSISMNFNAAASQAGAGSTITAYEWRSNGTVISTASSLTFPFGAAYHAITLKVTNSAGLSNSATATIIVTENTATAPAAAISMISGGQTGGNGSTLNYTVAAGSSITMSFNGSASQPGTGSITNYEWRSNGTVISNLPSFNFPFAAASHTITLKVTNSSGLSNTATATIVVTTSTSTPQINSVSPNPVTGSNSAQPFTINGSGFTSQSTITLRDKSTGEVFSNRAISSRTSTQLVINPNFTTAAHTWSVEVLNGSQSSGEFTFQVVAPATTPAISSVSPNPMTGSSSSQTFTINGSGFTSGSTVTLRSPFQTYPNQPTTSINSSQIVMQVNLGTTAAQWTVEVLNGSLSSGQFAFQVVAPAATPAISSVSPNPVTGSNSSQPFTINGSGFTSQSTVTLRDLTTGEVFTNRAISSRSSTQLVINPNFTTAAHTWSVEVINGTLSSGQFTFQVVAPAAPPTISSVSPNPMTGSNSSLTLTINGSGFTSGSTVTLRSPFQTYPNQPTTSITSSRIVMQVNVSTTAAQWTVEVLNGSLSSGQFAFQVIAPVTPPTISSVSPNPVTGSNSTQPFTINGSGFTSSSTVTLRDKSTGEVFTNRTISSRTSTQIVINPNFTTAAHTWSVEVLNGSVSSGEFNFQVIAPAVPQISSVSPNPMTGSDSSQTLTINGSGFTSGSTVTLRSPFQTYTNQPTSSITSTRIVMQVNLGTTAAQWTVEVLNGSISSGQFAFQVVAPAPRINSVSPNPVTGSNSSQPFTINGSGFTSQSTVTLRDKSTGEVFSNRAVSSRSSTQLVINPNFTTAAHTWSVEVLNGSQSSGEFTFQVVAPAAPSISSISPTSPLRSSSDQNVTVFGSNFQSGLTVFITFPSGGSTTLSGSQIQNVTSTSFVMVATLSSTGSWSIRVNNPDGRQSSTFSFTVR